MADATLPTMDEINMLPQWARVAFAARCARRAQPIFRESWPDAPEEFLMTIERAIAIAEHYATATISKSKIGKDDIVIAAAAAAESAFAAADAAARITADAAAYTADTAGRTAAAAAESNHIHNGAAVAAAVRVAARAGVLVADIRSEYRHFLDATAAERWSDLSPIDFPTFDTDSSDDETEDEAAFDMPSDFAIHAFLRDGVDTAIAKDKLLAIYNAMNEFSIAKFGKAITIKDFQEHVMAGLPAGVCS